VEDGLVLRLTVVPGASRTACAGALADRRKLRVAACAHDGQANRAACTLIGAWLGRSQVAILSGAASAAKSVHVPGLSWPSSAQLAAAGLPCERSGKE
jgi:uncharacterized protein (TIGR00251 family)